MTDKIIITYRSNGQPLGVQDCDEDHIANTVAALANAVGETLQYAVVETWPDIMSLTPIDGINGPLDYAISSTSFTSNSVTYNAARLDHFANGCTLVIDDVDVTSSITWVDETVQNRVDITPTEIGTWTGTLSKDGYTPVVFTVTRTANSVSANAVSG
ncbi:hypothetical protein ACFODL_15585 [Phenylobacterium terrae]|uniref:Virion structural protein n=1 Tax=Phenylobacterium terrae TaxID=2665495 RepID=A0ABW4N7F4_9CAUL